MEPIATIGIFLIGLCDRFVQSAFMHPTLSLDSLRCFLEAARTRNFRLAARVVALTPTAFGQRIK
jgi:hypothetical protein